MASLVTFFSLSLHYITIEAGQESIDLHLEKNCFGILISEMLFSITLRKYRYATIQIYLMQAVSPGVYLANA